MFLFPENIQAVWGIEPKNWTGAASTGDYASMKLYARCAIVIQTGAWAAGSSAITLEQATAVAGTGTKALGFSWQWNDEAATGTFVKTAVTSDTFLIDTANKTYIIDIQASTLDVANSFDCITVKGATPGANADFYGAMYYMYEPRFAMDTMKSAIAD